jgi:predicted DNA-binding transcriptional regulator AlpA
MPPVDDVLAPAPERADTETPTRTHLGQQIRQQKLFDLLDIGRATGFRLIASGKIGPKPIRLGGCLRYDFAEVLAWLDHRQADGTLLDAKTWPAVWARLKKGGRP